jgi:predicted RNA-binding protein with RPS1 domain
MGAQIRTSEALVEMRKKAAEKKRNATPEEKAKYNYETLRRKFERDIKQYDCLPREMRLKAVAISKYAKHFPELVKPF